MPEPALDTVDREDFAKAVAVGLAAEAQELGMASGTKGVRAWHGILEKHFGTPYDPYDANCSQ